MIIWWSLNTMMNVKVLCHYYLKQWWCQGTTTVYLSRLLVKASNKDSRDTPFSCTFRYSHHCTYSHGPEGADVESACLSWSYDHIAGRHQEWCKQCLSQQRPHSQHFQIGDGSINPDISTTNNQYWGFHSSTDTTSPSCISNNCIMTTLESKIWKQRYWLKNRIIVLISLYPVVKIGWLLGKFSGLQISTV